MWEDGKGMDAIPINIGNMFCFQEHITYLLNELRNAYLYIAYQCLIFLYCIIANAGTEILVWAEIPTCSQDQLMIPAHKLPVAWPECVR